MWIVEQLDRAGSWFVRATVYEQQDAEHYALRQRMIEDMNSRKLCALAQPRKKPRKAPEKAPEKGNKETSSTEQPPA
jgi:hypothetical protein